MLLAGGVAAGKTTLRRQKYNTGYYVVLDAAEIFINLCWGQYLDFPGPLEEPLDLVGCGVARRIFKERRHFVTEIIGHEMEPTKQLIDAITGAGFHCEFAGLTLDVQVAWDRSVGRGKNNISAYYAEPYHCRWILAAAEGSRTE